MYLMEGNWRLKQPLRIYDLGFNVKIYSTYRSDDVIVVVMGMMELTNTDFIKNTFKPIVAG